MANILIIEDSPTDTHAFSRALEKAGHSVDTAPDGAVGIEKAVTGMPDLILMDVVMPGVNGFQATRELQKLEATSDIPVVIITTKDQETDRIWGMRQGATEFLVKPVKAKVLVNCVQKVLSSIVVS